MLVAVGATLAVGGSGPWGGWLLAGALAAWLLAVVWARPTGMCVLVVACLLRLVFLASTAHSDDVFRYVWEGRIQAAGANPYRQAPTDDTLRSLRTASFEHINHPDLPTIYPPLAQAFFRVMTAVGLEEVGFKNTILLLDCAVVMLLVLWLRDTGRPPRWVTAYAWSPVAVGAAAMGHLEPLMLLPLVGFVWAAERRAPVWAAAWLALAILAKLVPILLLPWLFVRHVRAALLVTVPLLLLGYLPWLLDGFAFGSLGTFAADFTFNASLVRVAEWGLSAAVARPLLAVLLLAWIAFLAYAEPRPAHAAMLALGGLLLASPTVHAWYLTWFLVLLPAVLPRRAAWPFLAWGATVVCALPTYIAARQGGAFVEHAWLTTIEYALPALVAAVVLWRHAPTRRPVRLGGTAASGLSYTVVIPAMGERDSLARLLPAWMRTDAVEVVVADTPTDDGTEALVASYPRARYVAVPGRGYGRAVAAGWRQAAPSDVLVICDADAGAAPAHVGALLAPLADPAVGLVTGARPPGDLGWSQRAGNGLATWLMGWFWGRRFHDLGPFRAVRRAALPLRVMRDPAFGWNVEMNVRALQLGLDVEEVAVPVAHRTAGENRISATWRGIFSAGRGILGRIHLLREEACSRAS